MKHALLKKERSDILLADARRRLTNDARMTAIANAVYDMPLSEVGNRVLTMKGVLDYGCYIEAITLDGNKDEATQTKLHEQMAPLSKGLKAAIENAAWQASIGCTQEQLEAGLMPALQKFADGLLDYDGKPPTATAPGFKIKNPAALTMSQQITTCMGEMVDTLQRVSKQTAPTGHSRVG